MHKNKKNWTLEEIRNFLHIIIALMFIIAALYKGHIWYENLEVKILLDGIWIEILILFFLCTIAYVMKVIKRVREIENSYDLHESMEATMLLMNEGLKGMELFMKAQNEVLDFASEIIKKNKSKKS